MRRLMPAIDMVFNIWMIVAAVLVFLKFKKLITWDWGIVLAPVFVAVIFKIAFSFFNRA